MMRVVRQWLADAVLSARRAWRTTLLALVVITTAVLVLSLSLSFSVGVRMALTRLAASAELSVFLADGASDADQSRIADMLRAHRAVEGVRFVTRTEALERFTAAFPDLAGGIRDDITALPLSFDVTLRSGAAPDVESLAAEVRALPSVSDVRYDQQWIERLERIGRAVSRAGLALGLLLVLAAWTMLYAVVRLSYVARRDEIDILYLVGAPLSAIRGPFVLEGVLQGVLGAVVGLITLRVLLPLVSVRLTAASTGLGFDVVPEITLGITSLIVAASGAAGALAAAMALRDAERQR